MADRQEFPANTSVPPSLAEHQVRTWRFGCRPRRNRGPLGHGCADAESEFYEKPVPRPHSRQASGLPACRPHANAPAYPGRLPAREGTPDRQGIRFFRLPQRNAGILRPRTSHTDKGSLVRRDFHLIRRFRNPLARLAGITFLPVCPDYIRTDRRTISGSGLCVAKMFASCLTPADHPISQDLRMGLIGSHESIARIRALHESSKRYAVRKDGCRAPGQMTRRWSVGSLASFLALNARAIRAGAPQEDRHGRLGARERRRPSARSPARRTPPR